MKIIVLEVLWVRNWAPRGPERTKPGTGRKIEVEVEDGRRDTK